MFILIPPRLLCEASATCLAICLERPFRLWYKTLSFYCVGQFIVLILYPVLTNQHQTHADNIAQYGVAELCQVQVNTQRPCSFLCALDACDVHLKPCRGDRGKLYTVIRYSGDVLRKHNAHTIEDAFKSTCRS